MGFKNIFFFSILAFLLINNAIYLSLAIAVIVTIYTYRASLNSVIPDQQLTFNNLTDYINQIMTNLSNLATGAIQVFTLTFIFSVITISVISIYLLYIVKINQNNYQKTRFRR